MLLKTGLKKYKCNVGTNSMFFPVGEYLLTVTGRMYSPQKRTIKHRSLGLPVIKWLDFPTMHFYKYEFNKMYESNKFYYSCLLEEGDELKIFYSHNTCRIGGLVCLGSATGDGYLCKNDLDMDEFISLFWQTEFSGLIYGNLFTNFLKIMPILWRNEGKFLENSGFNFYDIENG